MVHLIKNAQRAAHPRAITSNYHHHLAQHCAHAHLIARLLPVRAHCTALLTYTETKKKEEKKKK